MIILISIVFNYLLSRVLAPDFRRQACLTGERGICYIFVVAPNKETIYGEYLLAEISLYKGKTFYENFLAYMKEKSDIPILDLRQALLEEKQKRRVCLSYDIHWNAMALLRVTNN